MSEGDDDVLGSAFGLGSVLADVGVDANALSAFLEKTEGKRSRDIEQALEEEGQYMDDVSDDGLPEETEEDKQARRREQAAIKAEEERWARRAANDSKAMPTDADKRRRQKREETEKDRVMTVWPDYKPGTMLKMSEVFYETPAAAQSRRAGILKKKRRSLEGPPKEEHAITVDQPKKSSSKVSFLLPNSPSLPGSDQTKSSYLAPIGEWFDPDWIKDAREIRREEMTRPPPGIDLNGDDGKMLDSADWESDVIMCSLDPDLQPKRVHDPNQLRNTHIDAGDWSREVVWDARSATPDLVEDHEDEEEAETQETKKTESTEAVSKLDKFNIGNDHLYEHTRASRYRIRQTFGAIEVFHSIPAQISQMPFYKTTSNKNEARTWHRTPLQFPNNVWSSFAKLKPNPNKSKGKFVADPAERFKTTKDLSVTEKCPFASLEFSEECPPIMSGYGMGTTIVNYYRKKDDKDEHVPKLELGQPSILNVGDAEPFLLGYVDPGKVTQVIHNNLIRAPIFKHQPENTDFLVIRQTINGHATYYIREINHSFTVGQTVPNMSEVPGPHARKNTTTAKHRLMIVAWILIKKNKDPEKQRVKLARSLKYFPDQTESQMRQRLKIKGNEFLEYDHDSKFHSGYWKSNPKYDFPKEKKDVLRMVTPEYASLYEAMQVGAQHLRDAGYTKTADGNAEDEFGDKGEEGLDVEQRLAVWATTSNYKRAEAQKAWSQVHGDGDPTGRGEGFSFSKTNMKNYFSRKGETEEGRRSEAEAKAGGGPVKISNAEQSRIYEEEKRKVWDSQWAALSNPKPPSLTQEDEHRSSATEPTPAGLAPRFAKEPPRQFSRAGSLAAPAFDSPMEDMRSPSAMSFDGESQFTGNDRAAAKVLRINRVVKGKRTVEIVRDPQVITSYSRRVEERKSAQYTDESDNSKPTGNMEEDELKIQASRQEVIRLKKNQQRRQQRKKYAGKGESPDVGEGEGKRRCGACGAYGHTKANRNCPKFNQNVAPSPSTTTPVNPTPFGYGMMDAPVQPTEQAGPGPMKIKLALGGR